MHVFCRSAVEIMDWFGVESTPKYRTPFPSILECNDTSRKWKRHFLHTPLVITERKNARHFHNRQLSASLKYIVSKSRTSSFVNAALFPPRVQKSTKCLLQQMNNTETNFLLLLFFRAKKRKVCNCFIPHFCTDILLISNSHPMCQHEQNGGSPPLPHFFPFHQGSGQWCRSWHGSSSSSFPLANKRWMWYVNIWRLQPYTTIECANNRETICYSSHLSKYTQNAYVFLCKSIWYEQIGLI